MVDDHVGRLEHRGLDGVEQSTRLYRALIDDLAFEVLDQVAEDDRGATRFAVTGANGGRRLRLEGITLSRLRDGRIVEDWSVFDTLELLRQLGVRRTLLAAPRMLRALRYRRVSGAL